MENSRYDDMDASFVKVVEYDDQFSGDENLSLTQSLIDTKRKASLIIDVNEANGSQFFSPPDFRRVQDQKSSFRDSFHSISMHRQITMKA